MPPAERRKATTSSAESKATKPAKPTKAAKAAKAPKAPKAPTPTTRPTRAGTRNADKATPARAKARTATHDETSAPSITITISLDQAANAAAAVARIPLSAARKVAPSRVNGMKGLPVYLGLGGLTVAGLVEWPFAAAAGAGYAALRRWGPLKPDQET